MSGILTEIALQLKGNLSFLLGLGGMFTITRSLVTGLLLLPKSSELRPALAVEARGLRCKLYILAAASSVLLTIAGILYFSGPISAIDAEALKKPGTSITVSQQWAIAALVLIAVVFLLCDALSSVYKQRLGLVIAKKD